MYTHTRTLIYTHLHSHTHTHTLIYTHLHSHTHSYTHTYTHTHTTHTHAHTQIPSCRQYGSHTENSQYGPSLSFVWTRCLFCCRLLVWFSGWMCVRVCARLCVYLCFRACVLCVCACVCARVCACVCACVYVCALVYARVCVCSSMYAPVLLCVHTCMQGRPYPQTTCRAMFAYRRNVGLARTVYIHRIWPYIWWIPCQKYRIYSVYIWFWSTLMKRDLWVGESWREMERVGRDERGQMLAHARACAKLDLWCHTVLRSECFERFHCLRVLAPNFKITSPLRAVLNHGKLRMHHLSLPLVSETHSDVQLLCTRICGYKLLCVRVQAS